MPEGNATLVNLRKFVYPSFSAINEDDMRAYAVHHAAGMLRYGTTLFEEPGCTNLEAAIDGIGRQRYPGPDRALDVGSAWPCRDCQCRLAANGHCSVCAPP